MPVYLSFILWIFVGVICSLFLKQSQLLEYHNFLIGMFFCGLTAFPIAMGFRFGNFSAFILGWQALAVVTGTVLGYFLYHEPITVYRTIAIVFSLLSLFFASL
jgi:multidrug transporter EmrE-like cation transporter